MTKVHCLSQEYWTVTPMKCQCGTAFTRRSASIQRLYERQSVDVDMLRVRCENCGREADLEFDNPAVTAPSDAAFLQRLLGAQSGETGAGPELGIESVLKCFSELAASGDIDALEYLIDAGGHFLDNARELSVTAPN